MKKLTKKQELEKKNLEWFGSFLFKQFPPHEGEFEEYLAHSERGKIIKGFVRGNQTFNVYDEAKIWRGRMIHELWEDSFYKENTGWIGLFTLLGGESKEEIMPRYIVDFVKKEMFAGQDANLIEEIYQKVLVEHNAS